MENEITLEEAIKAKEILWKYVKNDIDDCPNRDDMLNDKYLLWIVLSRTDYLD